MPVRDNFSSGEEFAKALRDWFAGQVIMGLCADPTNHELFSTPQDAAENAWFIADAMLAERDK